MQMFPRKFIQPSKYHEELTFSVFWAYICARIWQKVPNGYVNQILAHVASAKYYLLRRFPGNLKQ